MVVYAGEQIFRQANENFNKQIFGPIGYNVKAYGAKGDGNTDDTPAFTKVLEYINKMGGGTMIVPDGVYRITSSLRVYANTTIWMTDNAVIQRASIHFSLLFYNGEAGNESFATGYSGDGNITFYGGTLDINDTEFPPLNPTDYGGEAIAFAHAENLKFENLKIINGQNNHFVEINSSRNAIFKNCKFFNMTVTGTNLYEMLQLDVASSAGFPLFGSHDLTPCNNVLIEGCTFDTGYSGIGSHSSVVDEDDARIYHTNIRVSNCHITNQKVMGIQAESWKNFVIEGCTIQNDASIADHGIRVNASQNGSIVGNAMSGGQLHSIIVSQDTNGNGYKSSNIQITGNNSWNYKVGVYIDNGNHVSIIANQLHDLQGEALNVSNSDYTVFRGNDVFGVAQNMSITFNAVTIGPTTNYTDVSDNRISNLGYTRNYTNAISVLSGAVKAILNFNKIEKGSTNYYSVATTDYELDKEVYLVTGISVNTGTVTLSDDVTKYRHLIVQCGTVSSGNLTTGIVRPFNTSVFVPGTDFINVRTTNGKFVASIDSNGGANNQLTITTANDNLRMIRGVKI